MANPSVRDEDELEPLPPLDGDSTEQPEAEPDYAELLEEGKDEATLDDATGEDDPLDTSDLDLESEEGGWLGEAGEAQDLDLGDVAIVDFGDEAAPADDVDEPGVGEEDFGFGSAPERGGLDAGEEGPLDADEELREADLPALDADEEGELDDAALVDAGFASDEPLGLPWATQPWSRVGAPIALVGATAVACVARGALALGRSEVGATELVRVDLEGTCERLPAEGLDTAAVRALTVEGDLVAAIVQGGRLLISGDGGRHFAPLAEPIAEGVAASDAVFASGRLWVRTRTGGLLVDNTNADSRRKGPPAEGRSERARWTIERCPVPGVAAAITRDAASRTSGVAVLVVDDSGQPTALVRAAAGAAIRREVIDAPEARAPALFAAHGEHVAYAARRGGVVRRTTGSTWSPFAWEGRVTALAFVDAAGTLVVATYSDADDTTALVRLDAAGHASVVARIGAAQPDAELDGCAVAMAHDEARGVVWIAGGFGVATFATR
jgi:hypothetical protein